ncbi:LPXTG-motif cell wall anchor domain-containing protein, partial [Peptostreptococcaceae bacterium pGA-8]
PAGTEVSATQKEEGKIPSAPTKQTVTQTEQSDPGASKPSEHKKDAAPKTGDAGNMMSYGWMLIASGSVLALMKRRRHLK